MSSRGFPPEPNGYLHLGHAKSICLNFGIALENDGICNLRFDDTNPVKEDTEYVDSITEDVKWLIDGWADSVLPEKTFFASDYFEQLYGYAVQLIQDGKAYVCELQPEVEEYRGVPEKPGKESPGRSRLPEENLTLFERMRCGGICRWRKDAAREDRHGLAESAPARSGDLSHPP